MLPLVSIVISTYNKKEKLARCLESLKKLTYPRYEIIVIDNGCDDNTSEMVGKKFPHARLNRIEKNSGPAVGRNVGIRLSKGEFVFILDDDNVVDKAILTNLVDGIQSDRRIGIVGPKMYYLGNPNKIWVAGGDINPMNSRTSYLGNVMDNGQFEEKREVGHFPNAFLVRKSIAEEVGGFDESYFFIYEESDFSEQVRRAGYKIVLIPSAKTWHDIDPPENIETIRKYSLHTSERAYYMSRNRALYMKKNSSLVQYLIFLMGFFPLINLQYILIILLHGNLDSLKNYAKGIVDGLCGRGRI